MESRPGAADRDKQDLLSLLRGATRGHLATFLPEPHDAIVRVVVDGPTRLAERAIANKVVGPAAPQAVRLGRYFRPRRDVAPLQYRGQLLLEPPHVLGGRLGCVIRAARPVIARRPEGVSLSPVFPVF